MEEAKKFVQDCLPTLSTEDIHLIMETFFYLGVESFEDLQYIEPEKDLSSVLKHIQARKLKRKIEIHFNDQAFQTQVLNWMEKIDERLNKIDQDNAYTLASVTSKEGIEKLSEDVLRTFPLRDQTEFTDWEELLTCSENFKKMVQFLSKVGGFSLTDTTRRILKRLMTADLASNFNWAGRGSKIAFKDTKMNRLVISAVQENKHLENVNSNEIEEAIKCYLKYAPLKTKNLLKKTQSCLK